MVRLFRFIALMVLACTSLSSARSQDYPTKPVFIVVPYAAGGGMDVFARSLAQRLSDSLGQAFQVDNRPGANARLGSEYVARSDPDGYRLLMSDTSLLINPVLYSNMSFDVFKDLTPVSGLAVTIYGLVVGPSLPVNNLEELIERAKAKPGQLNYATFGVGSPVHLAMELLQTKATIKLNHIPYRGSGPALVDVIAGRVDIMLTAIGSLLPYLESGGVKMLAIATEKRATRYPDVPTISEAGVPGFAATGWWGLHAPAQTPRAIIEKIGNEVRKILSDPEFRAKNFDPQGTEPLIIPVDEFANFTKAEAEKWGNIARDANLKLEN